MRSTMNYKHYEVFLGAKTTPSLSFVLAAGPLSSDIAREVIAKFIAEDCKDEQGVHFYSVRIDGEPL